MIAIVSDDGIVFDEIMYWQGDFKSLLDRLGARIQPDGKRMSMDGHRGTVRYSRTKDEVFKMLREENVEVRLADPP